MVEWSTLLAAFLGGLFGIGASIGSVELTRRRQADQWHRELLMQVCSDALKSMQRYMREVLTMAFGDGPPYQREIIDGVEHVLPLADSRGEAKNETFDQVISDWNSALHQLLITAPEELVSLSREIDAELDRLLDMAIDEQWSREAFRAERMAVGRLAAQFVQASRRAIGAGQIELENVWTWADPLPGLRYPAGFDRSSEARED